MAHRITVPTTGTTAQRNMDGRIITAIPRVATAGHNSGMTATGLTSSIIERVTIGNDGHASTGRWRDSLRVVCQNEVPCGYRTEWLTSS